MTGLCVSWKHAHEPISCLQRNTQGTGGATYRVGHELCRTQLRVQPLVVRDELQLAGTLDNVAQSG